MESCRVHKPLKLLAKKKRIERMILSNICIIADYVVGCNLICWYQIERKFINSRLECQLLNLVLCWVWFLVVPCCLLYAAMPILKGGFVCFEVEMNAACNAFSSYFLFEECGGDIHWTDLDCIIISFRAPRNRN